MTTLHQDNQSHKNDIWQAIADDTPLPPGDFFSHPVTVQDVYYLVERWATLIIWNAADLHPAGEKILLSLPRASKHYVVYDRGSCLVTSPKELFSHERTLRDALQTAEAIGEEVYTRGWAIEFAGFDKMVTAAWAHIMALNELQHKVTIYHFTPTAKETLLYNKKRRQTAAQQLLDRGNQAERS